MRTKNALLLFLILVTVASTLFAATVSAATIPVQRTPANTGFAGQGQFRQGMQTGIASQGQAGGIVAPQQNFPAQVGTGQQRGAGIVAGDMPQPPFGSSPTSPIGGGTIGQGGPGTCYCIRAPCNCGGTGSGTVTGGTGTIGTGPILTANQIPQTTAPLQTVNQPVQAQQFPAQQQQQPLQTQTFQGQQFQPFTTQASGIQPRQF